jgi:hypothetical protein
MYYERDDGFIPPLKWRGFSFALPKHSVNGKFK